VPAEPLDPPGVRQENNGPPCRRCTNRSWEIESRRKGSLRWIAETVFAAPDVWIFQSESAGWPAKLYERWKCTSCGRVARVS
jgi:hypothetical protein